ncbi:hypothetical protein CANARDRAFT_178035 [[Candida] arabinofermentans NRRL YB-2248]|uniref:Ubiquitin fusion degradation protein 1 n=1 Tax=[Candida] arabinofermentans NRRL YB-2248 TaxID=983967 RepID=A0A1E4SU98_9ASCO|nr:hypothetical protein CANARDRAFT_178035 [[Candida] arabinofermentans NRRL YB-2248]
MVFDDYFRCYPISMMPDTSRKEDANFGGKIFLPQTALHKLTMLNIRYPMLFTIRSETSGLSTHSGVLEFTAEEGRCYLPQWMLNTIDSEPGSLVNIQTSDLPQGSFVKLEPQSVDFLEISDPKAVLENSMRNFTTLTVDDIIEIDYNDQTYRIKILEVKPESRSHGICIIETDLETDFAPPVGYVEPDYQKLKEDADKAKKEKAMSNPALKGQGAMAKQINYKDLLKEAINEATKGKFDGEGIKLSGKKITEKEKVKVPVIDSDELDLSGPVKPLILPDGYLFFGYSVKPYKDEFDDDNKRESNQDSKKVVFEGQGQSLRNSKKRKDMNKSHPSIKDKARSPETIIIDSD